MATITRDAPAAAAIDRARPAYRAYRILLVGYIAAAVLAGLDKFVYLLTDWTQYLWPVVPDLMGISPATFMMGVGVVEVAAGILVAVRPRIGAYVLAAWLAGIIVNLLLLGSYYDIALRDLGLAHGALALAYLAGEFAEPRRS